MSSADREHLLTLLAGQGLDPAASRALFEGLEGNDTSRTETPVLGPPRASRRREKVFGLGRPRALDRNAKVRIMHLARCLSRRTEKGRAYGVVTAKALAVLEALLWGFHNCRSGFCFPGYERIAAAAGCARSTVAEAIKALEEAGILSWVNRVKRIREPCPDLLSADGWRWRVLRTSNAYNFRDPSPSTDRPISSKSEKPTGTTTQAFFSSLRAAFGGDRTPSATAKEAFGEVRGAKSILFRPSPEVHKV
jgi:hypothetical protein